MLKHSKTVRMLINGKMKEVPFDEAVKILFEKGKEDGKSGKLTTRKQIFQKQPVPPNRKMSEEEFTKNLAYSQGYINGYLQGHKEGKETVNK